MSELFIGCSGFSYRHWRGLFYPDKLPQSLWFDYYCTRFTSLELNVTFYRLPKPDPFDHWQFASPAGFTFTAKGSRYITHLKRLAEPEAPLARFFAGALHLGEKLRVVLWQFPPGFACNMHRLEQFLQLLSRYPVRNALEFRHNSWCCEQVAALCRDYRVALCIADWPDYIADLPLTADFAYIRRHGHGCSYGDCYSHDELSADAGRIRRFLEEGIDVFIYFNNDAQGFAPENAGELTQIFAADQCGQEGI